MAVLRNQVSISIPASTDLSTGQYKIVAVNSDGEAALSTAATDAMIGVLQNKPAAQYRGAEIAVAGVTKCIPNSAISEGDRVTATTGGFGTTTTTAGDIYVGWALTASAGSGQYFELLINPGYIGGTS